MTCHLQYLHIGYIIELLIIVLESPRGIFLLNSETALAY